jgi:glycosyltransferase involved in cell wall biosynthesis
VRIAIDATPLTCETGGIRRYVEELTRALALQFPADEIFLLTDQPDWQLPECLCEVPNVRAPRPEQQRFRGRWWSLGLPWALARNRIDVFHGADFAVPYLPLRPSVLVVHDLSPWKKPPLRALGAERVRSRTPHLLRLATMLLTPTRAIKRELAEHFAIASSKIAVTALAARDDFQAVSGIDVTDWLRRHCGVCPPYLVALASSQPRKNLERLLEAWQAARRICPNLSLVCVGSFGDATIKRYGLDGLRILGPMADQRLQLLLSRAVAFVYPSLYEGFGLPVLEAMQLGVPVITSQDAAIGEVAGSAALQVNATSTALLARAIVEVAGNPRLQADLRAKGIQRSSQFSWRATALLTRQTYVEAIRRF